MRCTPKEKIESTTKTKIETAKVDADNGRGRRIDQSL